MRLADVNLGRQGGMKFINHDLKERSLIAFKFSDGIVRAETDYFFYSDVATK